MFAAEAQENKTELDMLATLGTIYGVAELRKKPAAELVGTPVLIAENALVFFAWEEGDS